MEYAKFSFGFFKCILGHATTLRSEVIGLLGDAVVLVNQGQGVWVDLLPDVLTAFAELLPSRKAVLGSKLSQLLVQALNVHPNFTPSKLIQGLSQDSPAMSRLRGEVNLNFLRFYLSNPREYTSVILVVLELVKQVYTTLSFFSDFSDPLKELRCLLVPLAECLSIPTLKQPIYSLLPNLPVFLENPNFVEFLSNQILDDIRLIMKAPAYYQPQIVVKQEDGQANATFTSLQALKRQNAQNEIGSLYEPAFRPSYPRFVRPTQTSGRPLLEPLFTLVETLVAAQTQSTKVHTARLLGGIQELLRKEKTSSNVANSQLIRDICTKYVQMLDRANDPQTIKQYSL